LSKYLLDTDICIYHIKGKFDFKSKFDSIPLKQRHISEITLAELKFGVENSKYPKKNLKALNDFLKAVQILPIFNSLDVYAKEKYRLRKKGQSVDDFDLLIGASAVANKMILVTNNESHFQRIKNIEIENWTVSN